MIWVKEEDSYKTININIDIQREISKSARIQEKFYSFVEWLQDQFVYSTKDGYKMLCTQDKSMCARQFIFDAIDDILCQRKNQHKLL